MQLAVARTDFPSPAIDTAELVRPSFTEIYAKHFAFVWRNLRRLGVPEAGLNDAAQDAFVVVYRRLDQFEGRAPLRSWLYGIAVRVAHEHRRRGRRKDVVSAAEPDTVPDPRQADPQQSAERQQALRLLYQLLDELDADKRDVFVLAELEGMTAPEIADAVGAKVNTVYSRLRAARAQFDKALSRHKAQQRRIS